MTYKIEKITEDKILFTNGCSITYYHYQDCCEHVYAAFDEIDDLALEYEFDDAEEFYIWMLDDFGFKFSDGRHSVSVPCYNIQNGYYSSELDIRVSGFDEVVISPCAKKDIIEE